MTEHVLANDLQRIELKLDAQLLAFATLRAEVHGVIKPDLAEVKRKASLWGAISGGVTVLVALGTQLAGCFG
jgi:hypothetical protein